ncbi:BtrH N-terminal domain-containing protein [Micromonospora sp. WMMD1082]|uniref:BtrH N-terminal domain-containing protein n=1 Tax=Micromonospora sp. WMMD1082 TaxID=3016104 RepID=UPI00241771E7|nr:BtrH N-terminal domain-containing protein [Micromonospora sp. WMMD1082]MDG4795682.1 BtrH N-terminal domain-containing protein [Micromonospora sp. WMMD1082]
MTDLLRSNLLVPCDRFLSQVDGARLDCVSDAVAVLLAHRAVPDVRAVFARDWRFELRDMPTGPAQVALPPDDQDERLARRTGWRLDWRATDPGTAVDHWRAAPAADAPIVVVGDAYHLPWLPYYRREHMEHGFVVDGLGTDGTVHIVDPYENPTEWGRAVPTVTGVDFDTLTPALSAGRWAMLTATGTAPEPGDPRGQIAANVAAVRAAADSRAYERFVADHAPAGRLELENLTLQTWLIARNRSLHARWLADLPAGATDAGFVARFARIERGWHRAMESAYLALRRVRSGRRAPGAALDALRAATTAEVELARAPGSGQE